MREKTVSGIRVKFELFGNIELARLYIWEGNRSEIKNSEEAFISNPEIRKAVKKYKEKRSADLGESFGNIGCSVSRDGKIMSWREYYPFVKYSAGKYFGGKGIAEMAEYFLMRRIEKKYPQIEKIKHNVERFDRGKQLLKRKTKFRALFGISTSFKEEMEKLMKKIASNRKKAREKRATPAKPRRRWGLGLKRKPK